MLQKFIVNVNFKRPHNTLPNNFPQLNINHKAVMNIQIIFADNDN